MKVEESQVFLFFLVVILFILEGAASWLDHEVNVSEQPLLCTNLLIITSFVDFCGFDLAICLFLSVSSLACAYPLLAIGDTILAA